MVKKQQCNSPPNLNVYLSLGLNIHLRDFLEAEENVDRYTHKIHFYKYNIEVWVFKFRSIRPRINTNTFFFKYSKVKFFLEICQILSA